IRGIQNVLASAELDLCCSPYRTSYHA
ncbi:MAG: hypothetical protein QOE32_4281, partial [Pseudonocardiales bacterium]|nr:hypothetical protein [Pseudonocardiales bacterium]